AFLDAETFFNAGFFADDTLLDKAAFFTAEAFFNAGFFADDTLLDAAAFFTAETFFNAGFFADDTFLDAAVFFTAGSFVDDAPLDAATFFTAETFFAAAVLFVDEVSFLAGLDEVFFAEVGVLSLPVDALLLFVGREDAPEANFLPADGAPLETFDDLVAILAEFVDTLVAAPVRRDEASFLEDPAEDPLDISIANARACSINPSEVFACAFRLLLPVALLTIFCFVFTGDTLQPSA
nr:hypothetical protein [Myxococcales bacterium]